MGTVDQFLSLISAKGSTARIRRNGTFTACPCRTPEGFRNPAWHLQDSTNAPICNEAGMLPTLPVDVVVRGFVQPIQSTRATRLSNEILLQMFGEILADDHLGIFPCVWESVRLDFRNWSLAGEEYVEYDGRKFVVVNSNKIPDPDDGNPDHHWEVGLRLITNEVISN